MSMLAEPRKKVRYSTNPNGNSWANDTSGFGRQMLQRLGWSPGVGLGKNNDGIKEPVKAATKSDRRGLGKKADYALGSTQQLEDYAKLLKSLNKSYSTTKRSSSSTSLEDISESSSTRLHYSKFIRAKDTSKYDDKALRVILGGTHESEQPKSPAVTEQPCSVVSEQRSGTPDYGIKTITSTVSINDYFKNRLLELKAKSTLEPSVVEESVPESNSTVARSKKRKRTIHTGSEATVPENCAVISSDVSCARDSSGDKTTNDPCDSSVPDENVTKTAPGIQASVGECRNDQFQKIERSLLFFFSGIGSSPFSQTNLLSLPGYQPY